MRVCRLIAAAVMTVSSAAGCARAPVSENPKLAEARAKGLVPLERTAPEYPRQAALAGVQGCVTASFDVMPDGRTDNYQILDSKPQGVFVKATLMALKDWRFPERDEPIRSQQKITYHLQGYPKNERPDCELDSELPEVYRVK